MRFAIVSTPRSGNTWLLHLLSNTYEIPFFQVHNPADFDWKGAPTGCVVQCHWHPVPEFLSLLEGHAFQPIVLSRHPLDTLISILHFALNDPTERWLEGEGGTEQPIVGAMPRSAVFMNYATGPRATALLNLTAEWWRIPLCHPVKYEDLVANTERELMRLVDSLAVAPRRPIPVAVEAVTFAKLRKEAQNRHGSLHFWQGKPGHWKRLLTAQEADAIHKKHAQVFDTLGYECEPDIDLDGSQADANWIELFRAEVGDKQQINANRKKRIEDQEARIKELETKLEAVIKDVTLKQKEVAELQQAHKALLEHHHSIVDHIGPRALQVARRLSHISQQHPKASALLRRVFRIAG